ncbi:hypothetical protein YDYSY3_39430 [Paenibacillus chitinolyticus]|uniref:fibronectin type III domain-containing protein n=1 Tax=Paenibacillus chitinolyticus TaxID=79263 RepID=UPI0026E4D419|nr:fibronectin type III domain-containing protein [Paenibacillus chitinolyticus]GKS12943.1 hypothetical protein YDYSY3_39430 [Paenibacillus chitinolyticus]
MRQVGLKTFKFLLIIAVLASVSNFNGSNVSAQANSASTVNHAPTITVDVVPKRIIGGKNPTLSFSGMVSDLDNDLLTISTEVNGKRLQANNVPNTKDGTFWSLNADSRQIPDGTYTNIVITVTDGKESSTVTYTGEIIIDNTPPSAPKAIPSKLGWSNADYIDVTVEAGTDSGSGIEGVEYSTDGQFTWSTYTKPIRVTREGTYYVNARSVDKAGNVSGSTNLLIQIDRTPPEYPIITANTEWTSSATVKLQTLITSGSPPTKQEYRLSGAVTKDWTLYQGEFVIDTEGVTLIEARATDLAGNVGPVSSQEVRIDLTRPTDPIIKLSQEGWTNQDVSFTIESGSDQLSGTTYPRYKYVGDRRSTQFYGDPIWITTPGVTIVQAFSQDLAGNLSDPPVEAQIMIDRTNPTAPSLKLSEDKVTKNNVLVTLTHGTDADSGIDKSQIRIGDAGSWIDYTSPVEVDQEGKTNIYARSIDNAGNLSDETKIVTNIDRTKPTVPMIAVSKGTWTNDTAGVTFTIDGSNDETGVTYEYKINNGAYIQGNSSAILDEGETFITARATDEAGNKSDEVTRSVRIDRTKPVITFSQDNPASGNKTVEITYKDDLSGLQMNTLKYKVTRSQDEPTTWDDAAQEKIQLQLTDDGEWFVHSAAKDLAGNETKSTQKYIVQNIPDSPMDLHAAIIKDKTVTLTWDLPAAGINTTGYRYEIEEHTTGRNWRVEHPSNSITVPGLKGGTTYNFTVKASNAVGQSPVSSNLEVLTLPDAPGSLKVHNVGNSTASAVVSFEPVTSASGYKIDVRSADGKSIYEETVTGNVYQQIRNLTAGSLYTIYVSAVNASGEGTKSNVGYLTLPDIPGQLGAIQFYTNAMRLSWQAVNSSEGYNLYRDANEIYSGDLLQHMDTGLDAGTKYGYQVSAQNSSGEGEKSVTFQAMTLPKAVENLRATNVGKHDIEVSWDGVKGVDQYRLIGNGQEAGTVTANTYAYKFDQLNSGSLYTFSVVALNESGPSQESNLTLMTIPDAATNLVTTDIQENTAKVEWSPVPGANLYRITVDGRPYFTGKPDMDLIGLDGSKTYTVSVEAGNSSGFSEAVKITFMTKPYAPNNVSVDTFSTSSVTLKWDEVPQAIQYDISVAGKGLVGKVTANTAKIDHLQAGTEYTFQVRATNASGEGKERLFVWTTPTEEPRNLSYSFQVDGSMHIKWDPTAGAGSYVIRESGKEVYRGALNEVIVNGFTHGKTYNLELTALNKDGLESGKTPFKVVVIPKEPVGVTVEKVTSTDVLINFQEVLPSGAGTHYVIERDGSILTTIPASEKTFKDAGLAPGSKHTYQIFAQNEGGKSSSGIKLDVTLLPDKPGGISIQAIEENSAKLSWGEAAGADGYRIYNGKKLVTETSNTSLVLSSLNSATEYAGFSIVSFNQSGEGSAAPVTAFITLPTNHFDLSLGEETDHSLQLNWGKINGESVVISLEGKELYRGQSNSFTVEDLLPDTLYSFTVWTENSVGIKSQPKVVKGKTFTDDPLKPVNVTLRDVKEKTAYVDWDINPLVKSVIVKLNGQQVYAGSANSAYLSALKEGTTYTIEVLGVSNDGRQSKPVTLNLVTKVAMPDNLYVHTIGTNEAIILFNDVKGSSEYEYSLDEKSYLPTLNGLPRVELNGLSPDTAYSISVRAKNAAGTGSASKLGFRTLEANGDLYVSKIEPRKVTLKWNVPEEYKNRVIVKEEVSASPIGKINARPKMLLAANMLNPTSLNAVSVDGKTELVDNVVPSKTYKYSLSANDMQNNTFKAEAIVETLPGEPSGLKAELSGSNVHLNWDQIGDAIYVLRRNGLEVYRGGAAAFIDTNLEAGDYSYSLHTENKNGAKSKAISINQEVKEGSKNENSSNGTENKVPVNANFKLQASSTKVELSWDNLQSGYKLLRSGKEVYTGRANHYTDSDIEPGKVLSYQLHMELPDGSYTKIQEGKVSVPYPAPNLKLNTVVDRIGDNFADFSWTKMSGADSYIVYQGGVVAYQGQQTTFVSTNLNPNSTYDFEFAYKQNGIESERTTIQVTTTSKGAPVVFPKGTENPFTDIDQTFNKDQIIWLAKNGIIKGVSENKFEPNRKITRAEFTALIVRALNYEVKVDAPFKGGFLDVHPDDWFIPELTAAYEAGIIEGHSPERFAPGDVINREQTAKIVSNILQKRKAGGVGEPIEFTDKISISDWAAADVERISRVGIVNGYEDGSFRPKNDLTRAEATAIIYRIIKE